MYRSSILFLALTSGVSYADIPCEYDKSVETKWEHKIEKTTNVVREVFPYIDDTRKCIMSMDVIVDGETYSTKGDYVFGPDVTENYACEQATLRAKEKIIGEVSPEILTAQTDMSCKTEQKLVEVEPVEEKPVEQVEEKVIDKVEEKVVYSSIEVDKSTPNAKMTCVADWSNATTICYTKE